MWQRAGQQNARQSLLSSVSGKPFLRVRREVEDHHHLFPFLLPAMEMWCLEHTQLSCNLEGKTRRKGETLETSQPQKWFASKCFVIGEKQASIFFWTFYLDIFGCAGSSLLCMDFSCGKQGPLQCGGQAHCGGLSCFRAWALGHAGFSCCGSAQGFSFPQACGIFLDQGLNPHPLHWQMDSQPLDYQGSLKASTCLKH